MRDGWVRVALGELMTLEYGKALKEEHRSGEGSPVVSSAGVVGHHHETLTGSGPAVVVGRKGTAGSVHWSDTPCWPIDTAYWVRLRSDGLDLRFAYLLLQAANLPSICAQTGVPGLNREQAYARDVNLPTLVEQRRIVDLVEHLDAVTTHFRSVRESAIRALTELRRNAYELGDTVALNTLIDRIEAGKSPVSDERQQLPGERVVLKVSAVGRDAFDASQVKVVPAGTSLPESSRVHEGDLLMTRANTAERVGASCIVDHVPEDYFLCDKTLRLVPKDPSASRWIWHLLSSPQVRTQLTLAGTGTSGSMKNISQAKIRALKLPELAPGVAAAFVGAADSLLDVAQRAADSGRAAQDARRAILPPLLEGHHTIPSTYDELLDEVS